MQQPRHNSSLTSLLFTLASGAMALLLLSGCSSMSSAGGFLLDAGKAMIGMQPSADKAAQQANQPVVVPVTIYAGGNLNENDGTPMSAVGKIYYLKSLDTWQNMGETAMMADSAKAALGDSLVESHDLTLTPEGTFKSNEKVPATAQYIGIAVFFYAAAPERWKFAFDARAAADKGIVMGAFACALSVTQGTPVPNPNAPSLDPASLAFVQCVPPPAP
jgi:type VI secretion system protein VasD